MQRQEMAPAHLVELLTIVGFLRDSRAVQGVISITPDSARGNGRPCVHVSPQALPLNATTRIVYLGGNFTWPFEFATTVDGTVFISLLQMEAAMALQAELRERFPDAPGCHVDLTPDAEIAAVEGV